MSQIEKEFLAEECGVDESEVYNSFPSYENRFRYSMPIMIGTHVFHHIFKHGIVFGVNCDLILVDFCGDFRQIHRDFLLIIK